ncbi:rod-binding protein [Hirschia litorea]|uniref:Rod-binding protein n=1 Tax=Hirschia litorea TaxID=1199156 RepID=A0ABW2ILP7_9PROT
MTDSLSLPFDINTLKSANFQKDFKFTEAQTREKAEEMAKEFETMFLAEMLQPIFNQIETDGPFGGGQAEEAFRPMLTEQYAKSLSNAGGVGIAESVLTEILRMQGLED